jgi:hypothetical protein
MILMLSSQQIESSESDQRPLPIDSGTNIIRFRLRGANLPRDSHARRWGAIGVSPVPGIEKYERSPESDDDYRHRALVNLFCAIVIVVLIICGNWVMTTLVEATRQ